jgi:hypothetical protein
MVRLVNSAGSSAYTVTYCMNGTVTKKSTYWYGMRPLLPPGPQSLRPGGGSWIGRRLSMLRLSPLRPRLFGDGFRFHRDRRHFHLLQQ